MLKELCRRCNTALCPLQLRSRKGSIHSNLLTLFLKRVHLRLQLGSHLAKGPSWHKKIHPLYIISHHVFTCICLCILFCSEQSRGCWRISLQNINSKFLLTKIWNKNQMNNSVLFCFRLHGFLKRCGLSAYLCLWKMIMAIANPTCSWMVISEAHRAHSW